MIMRCLFVLVLLAAGSARAVAAQGVIVAPHAIYLDHRTRSASILLYNPGADPAEVSISLFFAYPVTDSVGHFTLYTPDSTQPSTTSATDWIEAFPRRMTIPPLQRQTIRLLARPPQGLADGEYWSRIMISAKGGTLPVTGADSSNIEIGLSLEVRTIIPLIYRKGQLQTGISISDLRTEVEGDSLLVRARLERQGRAAYIGTARVTLADERGSTVSTFQQPVAVYYDAQPVFALPLAPAGRYTLHLEVATQRSDIATEQLLRAPVARDSLTVTLP
jgi:P pilus assembly chaperone PapD